jgi:ATP-dependent helicase/nuclease subunit B
MKILFGMHLDGAAWSSQSASIGEVITGPLGLLSILETGLGLSGPSVHPVHRIDEYMKRLEKIDHELAWFHKSFSADPWSTARQLLEWRDELVESGWHGKMNTTGSPRLNALTQIENVDIPLSKGRSDRLREVISLLEQNNPVRIASILLTEPMKTLPPVWQRVLALLQKHGTSIDAGQESVRTAPTSNLVCTQAVFQGNAVRASLSIQDDSLILLRAENEWEAAEHLALWLVSKRDENDQVTIICGGNTSVLDKALSRHGLPRLGRSEPSRWREMQQILPLMLANAWKPVDVRRLVELLSLTTAPFPNLVCQSLLSAIAKEPGVGGRAWQNAINKIEAQRKQDLDEKGDPRSEEKAHEWVDEIQALLVEERYDPSAGIPEDQLRRRCQKVIEWLAWRIDTDPMLAEVVSQAREMQKLSMGKGCIPRLTVERMLDAVIGTGSNTSDSYEEAGLWRVVDHPGQITGSCGELIWWGFNDPVVKMPTYWSDQERAELQAAGINIEASRDFRSREAGAWQRGFMQAEKRFIGIHIAQLEGTDAYHHPFWDAICYAAARTAKDLSEEEMLACLVRECKSFAHCPEWEFAGRNFTLEKAPDDIPLQPASEYIVPASIIKAPTQLSYSQMSTMIGCPMKWALQYYAGLRLPPSQAVPAGNQMIGTFCHRIVEELYADADRQWDMDDAGREAGRLYDLLLPSMASELLLEGNGIENLRYRSAIVEAVRQLVDNINRLQLKVEKTEAPLQGTLNGIPFAGYGDLLLRDKEGHPFVLDMKWSWSSKYRRQEVEEGSALQLAAYAWMLSAAETSKDVHTGYFMLAQGQLISSSDILGDEATNSPHTMEEIWQLGKAGLNQAFTMLENGLLEARGVKELAAQTEDGTDYETTQMKFKEQCLADGRLYQSPPCIFCDFGNLCGWPGR